MFAQFGCWPADARRVLRELNRGTDTLYPSPSRMVQLNQIAVLPKLGLFKELGAVQDRRAGKVTRLQNFRPLVAGPGQEDIGEDRKERFVVRSSRRVGLEHRVRCQMVHAHSLAKPLPFLLVDAGDEYPPVILAPMRGRQRGAALIHRLLDTLDLDRPVRLHRQAGAGEGYLDRLTLARTGALEQR